MTAKITELGEKGRHPLGPWTQSLVHCTHLQPPQKVGVAQVAPENHRAQVPNHSASVGVAPM